MLPRCLHGQEVEEDPQGAGKAAEMRLTPLAAYPVHLVGNHNALRDTYEHECVCGEEKGVGVGSGESNLQKTPGQHGAPEQVVPFSVYHLEGGISLPLATPIKGAGGLRTRDTDQVTSLL